jgi:hydroxypyruvate isomerase
MAAVNEDAERRRPLRQVFARAPFGETLGLEELCQIAQRLGAVGIEAISDPRDWPLLGRYGLVCSLMRVDYGGGRSTMLPPAGPKGWGEIALPQAQGEFLDACAKGVQLAGQNGIPNVYLGCGSRLDVSSEAGADNAVAFLNQVKAEAEACNVTLNIENMNSLGLFAPPDSIFDRMAWGLDVVRRVNSPRVKILYDIYHAQLMEGNIARTLRENVERIGHIQVAGVPGRGPLDDDQELNFRYIGRAIAESGYTGFVGHEWHRPAEADPVEAMRKSMAVLDGRE